MALTRLWKISLRALPLPVVLLSFHCAAQQIFAISTTSIWPFHAIEEKSFIFVTLNFYLVIITSFIIQLSIRRWISIRFPFMCKTQHNKKKRYVLHSKAPIITTILHNSQQKQKKSISKEFIILMSWTFALTHERVVITDHRQRCWMAQLGSGRFSSCSHWIVFISPYLLYGCCWARKQAKKRTLSIHQQFPNSTTSGREQKAMEEFSKLPTPPAAAEAQLVLNHTIQTFVQLRLEVGNISSISLGAGCSFFVPAWRDASHLLPTKTIYCLRDFARWGLSARSQMFAIS